MTTITVKKNNTINKSTISSSNKSSKKDNEIKEKKTSKKESIDIQDFGSSDDEPILKKKKSTSKNNIPPSQSETKQETIHRNLDITILADMKINDRYSKITYLGLECIMDMTTGYINATKFCSSASDESKRFDNYIANTRYKKLFDYMISAPEYSGAEIIKKLEGGRPDLRGTYLHPDLLLDLASWISPSAYIKASRIVSNHLIREKEYEIRKLTGDKCELVKMLEEEKKERRQADKENKQLLLDMKLQNEKTHSKLDKTHTKLDKTKDILKRVETRVEKIVEEVVPPTKQVSLHEQFGIMILNDSTGDKQYKAYCCQTRAVNKIKNSIIKTYPQAVLLREVSPSPNSKNFLHQLKEKYGSGKKSKIKVSYNFIYLNDGVSQHELNNMLDEVIESNKNYGN